MRPTNAIAPDGGGVDAQEAGRRLGSDSVLTGTVRETGEHVRASVQLVRTADDSQVWGDQYYVPRGDLLDVEDNVA